MPSSPASSELLDALERLDAPAVQAALANGADPNAPLGVPGLSPLCWISNRSGPSAAHAAQREEIEKIARALMAAGAQPIPPGPQVAGWADHPLGLAIAASRHWLFDLLWQSIPLPSPWLEKPVQSIATSRQLDEFPALGLLELALAGGNAHAATRLLDQAPSLCAPAGPCPWAQAHGQPRSPRPGALVCAAAGAASPSMVPLFKRLLASPWPQQDLDGALSMASTHAAPLSVVQALLDRGARIHPDTPSTVPPLARLLVPKNGPWTTGSAPPGPATGVVAAWLAAGANPAATLDFELAGAAGPAVCRPSSLPLSLPIQDPGHEDPRGLVAQPLALAAGLGQVAAVSELLAAGADPHHRDARARTALHFACLGWADAPDARPGFRSPIDQLLDAGVDPTAQDDFGIFPLEYWMAQPAPTKGHPTPVVITAARLLSETLDARPDLAPRLTQALDARADLPVDALAGVWKAILEARRLCQHLDAVFPEDDLPTPRNPPRM